MDPIWRDLVLALIGLIVVVTNLLQSKVTNDARKAAKEAKDEAAGTKQTVHSALNGDGLGGKFDRFVAANETWQAEHERKDDERFRELRGEIAALKPRAG